MIWKLPWHWNWKWLSRIKLSRKWLRRLAAGIPVLGLATVWVVTLVPTSVKLDDPVAVARLYITDIQAARPNSAYKLLSDDYRKVTSQNKFGSGTAADLYAELPVSDPEYFDTVKLVQGKDKITRVSFNLPGDGVNSDYRMAVDLTPKGKDWYVNGSYTAAGKLVKGSAPPKQATPVAPVPTPAPQSN